MSRMLRYLCYLILLSALLLALCTAVAAVALQRYLDEPLPIEQSTVVMIEEGSTLARIAETLADQAALSWPKVFTYWVRWQELDRAIRTGEYALNPGLTPRTLLDLLISGRTIQYPATLIEGWTVHQALEAVWQLDTIEPTLKGMSDEDIHKVLQSPLPALEGSLFPDTYFHTRGTTDLALLKRASRRLQEVLEEEWQQKAPDLPYNDSWQALIMASMIERESGYLAEKEDIAGVFVRRLQRGMRLQSDPTVIYGMGDEYRGVIRRSDLEKETPWNTYRISGLPETPIALSGRDSIHAALNPRDGTALYFVARGDGSHHFSDTLEEHNQAVRRYLRARDD